MCRYQHAGYAMNNLREIKGRLRSIRKNRQIMSAMQMVSAVKLRRIQTVVQASRPYAQRLEALVSTFLNLKEEPALQHPLRLRRSVRRILWVVISTDRGLCGSLNTNLFRFIQQALRERAGAQSAVALLLIGRKACDFFKHAQAKAADFRIEQAYPLEEAQAEIIVRQVRSIPQRPGGPGGPVLRAVQVHSSADSGPVAASTDSPGHLPARLRGSTELAEVRSVSPRPGGWSAKVRWAL